MKGNLRRLAPETRSIHAGREHNQTSALTPPIFQTSTFRLKDAQEGAEFTQADAPTHFYTRWGNPTTRQCEAVLADIEGAERALVAASGMGAISCLLLTALDAGSHAIIGRSIYSGVSELASGPLRRFGVETSFVDARNMEEVEQAIRDETRIILVETPTNPTLELCDLTALGELGKRRGVLTAVDNTFATPMNQNPLAFSLDVVVHSATKSLGGHSDLTAGVLCGTDEITGRLWKTFKLLGASISPFESWLLLRGLKTLAVRVQAQSASALEIARHLEGNPHVERVHYPGVESHPQHDLATRQMRAYGCMVSFEVQGGHAAAVRVLESLRVIQLAVSLGGVESIMQHPGSMTHGMLPEDAARDAGIRPGLLRLSVGLENVRDLKHDLDCALGTSS